MSDTFDPWEMVYAGEVDPLWPPRGTVYCRERHREGYVCTRAQGHDGLHVASAGFDYVCADAWYHVTPEMRLPDGF